MARLKLYLFGETAPASALVLALGESLVYRLRKLSVLLKKMEALGSSQDKAGNVAWSHGLLP